MMTEAGYQDIAAKKAADECNRGVLEKKKIVPLQSVKIVGRIGYVNSDPAMPFMLPFGQWNVNDLTNAIMAACLDYDISALWHNAKTLSIGLAKGIIKDTEKGGFNIAD